MGLAAALFAQAGAQIALKAPAPAELPLYQPVDLALDVKGTFDNPFDPDQADIQATVSPPTGQPFEVPAFYAQDGWHLRLALTEIGANQITIHNKDQSGPAFSISGAAPQSHGFIRTSPRDFRFFEHQDGAPFFPIGANFPPTDLTTLQGWATRLAASGGNTVRLFIGPQNNPFALATKVAGPGKIDLANADRLDQAVAILRQNNLKVLLVVDTFNDLRDRGENPQWPNNPLNRDNGGPLDSPRQFWSSEAGTKLYLQKLRYLIARYGADPAVLGWEIWREVDQTQSYDPEAVRGWFERYVERLKAMDSYGHLVTTSFRDPLGERPIDRLGSLDFSQTHLYNLADLVPAAVLQQSKKTTYGKPHWVTEVAADRAADQSAKDPTGVQYHDPAWASVVSGAAGAPLMGWWDSYGFPKRIHNRVPAIANFVKGIDWPAQKFRSATPQFRFQSPVAQPLWRDLAMERGPISFENTEYNLPRRVRIWPHGVEYGLPVSGILHGGRLHPSKFNPITFVMDIRRATTFDMVITEVSGGGGAKLQVKLDGEVVMGMDMPDANGLEDVTPITKYNGVYSIQIPSGHHELTIANIGNDWIKANYRFRDMLSRKTPPLIGFSIVGDTLGLVWVRQADRSWDRLFVQKRPVVPSPPTIMTLRGLIAGKWRADLYDTWAGKVIKSQPVTVGPEGDAEINLPVIETDLAIKLVKIVPAKRSQ